MSCENLCENAELCYLRTELKGQDKRGGSSTRNVDKTTMGPYWLEENWNAYTDRVRESIENVHCMAADQVRRDITVISLKKKLLRQLV